MHVIPVLYLETSVFGFCFDENPRNQLHREAVLTLLDQARRGVFKTITSPLTTRELARAAEPLVPRLLALLRDVEESQAPEGEVEWLATRYLSEGVIPEKFADDARHVAHAALVKAEILVSLNMKHIANEWVERKINSINLREGYAILKIRTPEEVVVYED